jgi:toxin ParE1/3/4
VPRLVILNSANRDLVDIGRRIERDSGSREVADAFVDRLIDYCARIARLPNLMGRARPELHHTYRSLTLGNYVIFIAYESAGKGPRDILKVVHVLWGARDLDAYFKERPDDDADDTH